MYILRHVKLSKRNLSEKRTSRQNTVDLGDRMNLWYSPTSISKGGNLTVLLGMMYGVLSDCIFCDCYVTTVPTPYLP